jgi:hypothetical protein
MKLNIWQSWKNQRRSTIFFASSDCNTESFGGNKGLWQLLKRILGEIYTFVICLIFISTNNAGNKLNTQNL